MKNLAKSWLRSIGLIYAVKLLFILVAAIATGYALSHPELGSEERDQHSRAMISRYGPVVGLLLFVLYDSAIIVWLGYLHSVFHA